MNKMSKTVMLSTLSSVITSLCISSVFPYLQEKQLTKKLVLIDDTLNDINDSLDEIDARLDKMNARFDEMKVRVDELEVSFKEIEREVDIMNGLGKDLDGYVEMKNNLLSIKPYLNISSYDREKKAEIISIGDIVNLVNSDVLVYRDVYSLYNKTNSILSTYGTSELRYIRSIIMVKDYMMVEVDNMDDYELYQDIGFSVIGYNLVNQFSLNDRRDLITECRCDKDSVKKLIKK